MRNTIEDGDPGSGQGEGLMTVSGVAILDHQGGARRDHLAVGSVST